MRYTVQVYVNVREDGTFFLAGYRAGDPLATAPDLKLRVEADDWHRACEVAWRVGNREGADAEGTTWPRDVRSVSMGDVALVAADGANAVVRYASAAMVGWQQIAAPTHFVPLAGTPATSRKGAP